MLNMQNVKDIEIPEGDVRTIHDKDSRLIWGRLAYDTKYAGDTYQQTYSGKNLADFTTLSFADTNYGTGTRDGQKFTVTSTTNSFGGIYFGQAGLKLEPSTTYTFSAKVVSTTTTNGSGVYILDTMSDTGNNIAGNLATAGNITSATFTTPSTIPNSARIALYVRQQNASTVFTDLQIEKNSSVTSWEPYVGGIPAPNPDYPQDIQVVTGTQNVWVHGKNMLHGMSTTTATHSGVTHTWDNNTVTFSGTASGAYSNVTQNNFGTIPAGTYTFSTPTPSGVFKTNLRVRYDGTNYNYAIPKNGTSVTFTIPKEASTFLIYIDGLTAGTQVSGVYSYMLERNSTVTTYEPYQGANYTIDLGATELCKIGDYQDYIYKSGDDWYVHKEVDKYVFGGNESWETTPYGTNSWILSNVIYFNFDSNKIQIMSNIATGIAHADRNTTTPNVMYSGQNNVFNYRNTSFTTLSALQTATKDNYVYYAIATPTDTKITDATLIGQLNAVHEWLTRYGYNSTVTGNLPIIINQTNL